MAYSERIKDFGRIRDFMRSFYVYGFKGRGEYDAKSPRSYDNERRRVESWLGDYMSFRRTPPARRYSSRWTAGRFPAIPCTRPSRPRALQTRTSPCISIFWTS